MHRPRSLSIPLTVVVVTVLVLGGMWLATATRGDGGQHPAPRDEAAALAAAVSACDSYDMVIELIDQDAPAPSVLAELETLDHAATDAYEHDVSWIRMLSGARALRWALESDDGDAARAGTKTLDDECREVRTRDGG